MERQNGVALITALLVVALATSAAVAMVANQQLDIRRTGNMIQYEQAYLYVMGMEEWAARVLKQDARNNQVDHENEQWATQLPPIPIEGGEVSGHIDDLQGRFNLNSLLREGKVDAVALEQFRRLLTILQLDPGIADAVADWLDKDQQTRFPGGAEDDVYLGMQNPYRTGDTLLVSSSELLLLPEMTPEKFKTLSPHVTALPVDVPLNINTATIPVIMSLTTGINRSIAEMLVDSRGEDGYADIESFVKQPALAGKLLPVERLGVKSQYFMLTSQVRFGRISVNYQSMIERDDTVANTIMRAQGTL